VLEDQSPEPTSRHDLVSQLREGSAFLENQREDLANLWTATSTVEIVSFYETMATPKLVKVKHPPTNLDIMSKNH
jgi:hypothetical protein